MAGDNESKTAIALVDPLVGSIFDKRFRIEDRIAQGGFGAIYRATHVKSGHPIALKVLLPALAQDLGIVARFRREGDTLTALRNPHTITAYELGQAADRSLFIVMELLHGETLFDHYEQDGPFEWRRLARIARQVCESLDEAHARGIVHRDLKPTNIHLEQVDGDPDFVKVLDFGIAKILMGSDFDASEITKAGTMIGTLDYMSPEQMVGGQVTGQTDIYTLGIVMYEMIAGIRPFPEAQSAASALASMLKTTPQPLYLRAPVPEQVSAIVMRCLERETSRRYRTVADLARDLDELLGAGGSANVVLDSTKTYELQARERAAARSDEEATTFTPPPEKLLQELRTPKVERLQEWDDDDEDATTTGGERLEAARAASRAETNIADGIDPHGPTVAARPIEPSNRPRYDSELGGAKTPTVRREADAALAKTPTVRRDVDTGGARTPTVRRDSDASGSRAPSHLDHEPQSGRSAKRAGSDVDVRTPPFQRVDNSPELDDGGGALPKRDADARTRGNAGNPNRSVGGSFDADSQSRSNGGNPNRVARGSIDADAQSATRPKSMTRPPATPDPDAARPKSMTRPPATPDPDARNKPMTAPPPIPATPPVRPLQARNLPTPVPQVVVAPFSSTPRAPTAPPTGMPTPPPGSLPPGVPMPPNRLTPFPPGVTAPPTRMPTPSGTPAYPGPQNPYAPNAAHGGANPFGAQQPPSSNTSANPFGAQQPPSSNTSANPFGANQTPGSNPAANPFGVPGGNPSASPFGVPGSNPGANPFQVPGGNPSASPFGVPGSNPGAGPFGVPGSNPGANPFGVPGSNPGASPFGVPGSNPGASPFGVPGSNPGARPDSNPFLAGAPRSNAFLAASPLPPTPHASAPMAQYDMGRMAAREAMIRRLVWILALVVAAAIGFIVAIR